MTTAQQIRAGRALIGMGQKELADAADVAVATLRRMESDDVGPERSSFAAVEKVSRVLEAAGVIFIAENGEGPGVRLRKQQSMRGSVTEAELDEAYADGAEAYRRGLGIGRCPYEPDSDLGRQWRDGYKQEKAEKPEEMPLYEGDDENE